jgi:hypothetical protein
MTRNGKIARLPRTIREELNQRLEDGEPGVRLIEWLNGLPEVVRVLKEEFDGVPISDMNLSYWKNGGFVDWQAREKAESMIERWESEEFEGVASGKVSESLKERLVVHYAAAVGDALAETDEKPSKRVERLGRSLRDVVHLGRYDLARERERDRSEVERERLQMERERLDLQRARLNKHAPDPDASEQARLLHEQRAEMVKQMMRDAGASIN